LGARNSGFLSRGVFVLRCWGFGPCFELLDREGSEEEGRTPFPSFSGKVGKPNFVMPFILLDALGPPRDKVWANGRSCFVGSMSRSPWLSISGTMDGRGSYRLIDE
jgi:hypothetical protein